MALLIFIVVVLFILAIVDLIVGVSNDAVNFLNSAIGSKVAPFKTIILIAAAGVIIGSAFSSGIMEIARKGIFNPQYFTFDIILWVFLAVMLTDIILLDIFNTLGLPTSTTVSIIFELLGASLVAGILFSIRQNENVSEMLKYINASSVVTIISGIFLSIIIAFTAGIIVQYISRLLFSFNYEERLKKFGAFFAGLGITAIFFFLLIKGLKGTNLIGADINSWIKSNTPLLMLIIFLIGWMVIYLLQRFAGINPLKMVVMLGTFALAMAFAGNDLVNFIGVPITGFLAYQNWSQSGVPANELYQTYLAGNDVVVPNYMLLIAGAIMSLTLWYSSKARKVTETEVKLGSHAEIDEQFQSNAVARNIVKTSIMFGNFFSVIVPKPVRMYYSLSFKKSRIRQAMVVHDRPDFDLVRASVNLVLASSLIALATSFKLPLSTTYVSFMVAMGSSLADKAWGRETAVYRVAGVLSVIGGWLMTAVIAFTVSGLFVFILVTFQLAGLIGLIALASFYMIFSHTRFASRTKMTKAKEARMVTIKSTEENVMVKNQQIVLENLTVLMKAYNDVLEGLKNYDADLLDETFDKLKEMQSYGFRIRAMSIRFIRDMKEGDHERGEVLLLSSDLVEDITQSVFAMCEECRYHIKNLHQQPQPEFIKTTEVVRHKMNVFFYRAKQALQNTDVPALNIRIARDDLRNVINDGIRNHIRTIQKEKTGTKQALLETNVLLQSRDILAVLLRIYRMFKKQKR